jgi:RimJ/RimL family protein N-acetyltransferase
MHPAIITGNYVKLEQMNKTHIDGLYEASLDERIWLYMPMKVNSKEDMKKLVHNALIGGEKGEQVPYTIFNLDNGEIVGSTRLLDIQPENRNCEIGWTWLTPKVWRTKINTEMKLLLLQYCFEQLDYLRVQLKTDGRNVQSQKAIERLGATMEGTLRRNRIMYDGYVRDSVYYSILAEEWPVIKKELLNKLNLT